ncbi:hypothetical protein AVEN_16510-1 [Araneus ventricosus]|uniref:Uncharacterized protein n=1 Tax=Araneus ventricosus TaxID=182803 RepID=A0A4Y2RTP8_ARAVE|nr:hypothetical protein AVEN_16510-1 [Araneus ventricosus]
MSDTQPKVGLGLNGARPGPAASQPENCFSKFSVTRIKFSVTRIKFSGSPNEPSLISDHPPQSSWFQLSLLGPALFRRQNHLHLQEMDPFLQDKTRL